MNEVFKHCFLFKKKKGAETEINWFTEENLHRVSYHVTDSE